MRVALPSLGREGPFDRILTARALFIRKGGKRRRSEEGFG
ncbi:hypothetical protein A0123_00223 [Gluconobacter cerinus]|uniref:Uncharacterized protein n=1 Tax=Gluconobacter cerinus TaxID=38307 RepID=A0A1B6VPN4_9PROT|nr:hypothetical protein A0123_00223 [Gluconobacter cerinus]